MVEYKGTWLARNSEAYQIWESKDFKKLDKHLKQLQQNHVELLKRYESFETVKE